MQDIFTRIFYCEVLSWKSSDNEFLIEDDPIVSSAQVSIAAADLQYALRFLGLFGLWKTVWEKLQPCKFSLDNSFPSGK